MPSTKPLSLVVTEKLTKAQRLNILITHMRKRTGTCTGGYHISILLLRKDMLKMNQCFFFTEKLSAIILVTCNFKIMSIQEKNK